MTESIHAGKLDRLFSLWLKKFAGDSKRFGGHRPAYWCRLCEPDVVIWQVWRFVLQRCGLHCVAAIGS